jgi:PAS domain S-box-containing protein
MEEALRESETKFRLIIENSHDILYTLTGEGIFTFVSPAWTKLLGHSPAEVVGKSFQIFVHPEDLPVCTAFLQNVIKTGKRQEGVEYRVRRTDGVWRWHSSNAVPFTDEQGKVAGFYGIAMDITERKQKELEIKALIASLQANKSAANALDSIIPICANCKKIRDGEGTWEPVEAYITRHTTAKFSHGICPECMKLLYPDFCRSEKP